MSYKTLLVHVDKSTSASERVKLAAMIAVNENARLIGMALTGISTYIYEAGLIIENDPNLTEHLSVQLEILRERAREALNEFEKIAQAVGVRSLELQLLDDEGEFSLRARCNDLVVLGQPNPEEPSPAVTPGFPESVVINSARPVLIVPYAGRFDRIGSKVLIAWDDSVGATRAVTNALPVLRRADNVEIVMFNIEPAEDDHGVQSGDNIAQYLAHHGIRANVTRQQAKIDIGNALLSTATDLNSDLIVMGAYGHSRLREMLLGGVTRTVLKSMTVPVLISH